MPRLSCVEQHGNLTANVGCCDASGCTDGHRLGKISTIYPPQAVDDTIEQERLHRECELFSVRLVIGFLLIYCSNVFLSNDKHKQCRL